MVSRSGSHRIGPIFSWKKKQKQVSSSSLLSPLPSIASTSPQNHYHTCQQPSDRVPQLYNTASSLAVQSETPSGSSEETKLCHDNRTSHHRHNMAFQPSTSSHRHLEEVQEAKEESSFQPFSHSSSSTDSDSSPYSSSPSRWYRWWQGRRYRRQKPRREQSRTHRAKGWACQTSSKTKPRNQKFAYQQSVLESFIITLQAILAREEEVAATRAYQQDDLHSSYRTTRSDPTSQVKSVVIPQALRKNSALIAQTLVWLSGTGKYDELKLLLQDCGINADTVDEQGVSPLNQAIQWNQIAIVELLLQQKPSGNIIQENIMTTYSTINEIESTTIPVPSRPLPLSINHPDPRNGYTPLQLACKRNDLDTMKLLLAQGGANPNHGIKCFCQYQHQSVGDDRPGSVLDYQDDETGAYIENMKTTLKDNDETKVKNSNEVSWVKVVKKGRKRDHSLETIPS